MPVHFVLDHNFPWLAVRGLQWPPILRITPLVDVDRRLVANHDDWQVLIRLAQRHDVDSFITNDAGMLEEVREMVALRETSLTLVITDGVGHDPIRATGLLMLFLEQIARQVTARPTIYSARVAWETPGPPRMSRLIGSPAERTYSPIDSYPMSVA